MTGEIMVVPETGREGLVAEARRLADRLEETEDDDVEVVVVAMDSEVESNVMVSGDIDELCILSRSNGTFESGAAGVEARVRALETLVMDTTPRAVLLPATPDGDEIAARLGEAVRGGTLVDGLLQIRDGTLAGGRPAYDGRAFESYDFQRSPIIVSLTLDRLAPLENSHTDKPRRTTRTINIDEENNIERVNISETPEEDISRAPIVIAGGMGLDEPDDFEIVADLASALGGTLGASRPPVDAGWLPYDRQVGVTGKQVNADLYVACAISGDPYHMGAVEADTVVAINTDPEARIFDSADLGVVGDVYEYGPAIASAIREVGDSRPANEDPTMTGGENDD